MTTITSQWDGCTCWTLYSFSNLGVRLATTTLIFCSTLTFTWYFLFTTATAELPPSQRHHAIKSNVSRSNVETVNYIKQLACIVSKRHCIAPCFSQKFKTSC